MPIAGLLTGAGAYEGLKELLAQRMLERQQGERERSTLMDEGFRGQQLDLQGRQLDESTAFRQLQQQQLEQERTRDERYRRDALLQQRQMSAAQLAQARALAGEREAAISDRAAEQRESREQLTREGIQSREMLAHLFGGPIVPVQNPDGTTMYLPRGQAIGREAPLPAEQRNRMAGVGRSVPVLESIAELSERINTQQGVVAKITGAAERAKAQANLSDDVSEYQALVSMFTPLLARAVGHVGVLTEQDVQSVRSGLPQPGDSKAVRDRKMARIRTIMAAQQAPPGTMTAGEAPAQTAPPSAPAGPRRRRFNPATGRLE